MPLKADTSGTISNSNSSQNKSSDSSDPIEDRTVNNTTSLSEEDYRLPPVVWEEDNSNSNVDSFSDLGFVPSDFDPTPLDTLRSSSSFEQEEEANQLFAFRELLDSLESNDDDTNNVEDLSNSGWKDLVSNPYGSLDSSVICQDQSIYSTSDIASIHSDIFESNWQQDLEELTTLQDTFSLLSTRESSSLFVFEGEEKEKDSSIITNQLSKLSMKDDTVNTNNEIIQNEANATPATTTNAANISSSSSRSSPNTLNTVEETSNNKSPATTVAQYFIRAFQNEKRTQRSFLGHKETIFSVKFSPCKRFVATASQEATVKLWDVKSNKCVATLRGHHHEYECLRVAWASSEWTDPLLLNTSSSSTTVTAESTLSKETITMASSSANGIVKIWSISLTDSTIQNTQCVLTIDHGSTLEEDNIPQVYALQFITQWMGTDATFSTCTSNKNSITSNTHSLLLTSSDDKIHLWELFRDATNSNTADDAKISFAKEEEGIKNICYRKMLTYHFVCMQNGNGGVILKIGPEDDGQSKDDDVARPETQHKFGGERNPKGLIYVFDASHCSANGFLAVALADGSTRVINSRGVCLAILQLPGCKSHLTAVCWDSKGDRISTSVGTGQVILWRLVPAVGDDGTSFRHNSKATGWVTPSCQAVLQGGHEVGRALFGVQYCGGDDEELLLSWGVDGRLCLWDSFTNEYSGPIAILFSQPEYPIYSVDVMKQTVPPGDQRDTSTITNTAKPTDQNILTRIAIAGGRESGFVGMPFYLYNVIFF